MEDGEFVSLGISVKKEQVAVLNEWATMYDGNKSMVIRKLIEQELERRKNNGENGDQG